MNPREPRFLPLLAADPVAMNIAAGWQTQHRQPMRWQPVFHEEGNGFCLFSGNRHPRHSKYYNNPEHFRQGAAADFAPWRVGDALYVREAWALLHFWTNHETGWVEDIDVWTKRAPKKRPKTYWEPVYRASGTWDRNVEDRGFKWRPNILCPEWAARTTTKPLTRVWAERVQDVSEDDARAEGIRPLPLQEGQPGCWWTFDVAAGPALHGRSPVDAYRKMMNSFYPGIWERNDWLWCCAWDGVEVRT